MLKKDLKYGMVLKTRSGYELYVRPVYSRKKSIVIYRDDLDGTDMTEKYSEDLRANNGNNLHDIVKIYNYVDNKVLWTKQEKIAYYAVTDKDGSAYIIRVNADTDNCKIIVSYQRDNDLTGKEINHWKKWKEGKTLTVIRHDDKTGFYDGQPVYLKNIDIETPLTVNFVKINSHVYDKLHLYSSRESDYHGYKPEELIPYEIVSRSKEHRFDEIIKEKMFKLLIKKVPKPQSVSTSQHSNGE